MTSSDDAFGPRLPEVFDFTILFEQGILSLLPTLAFLVLAAGRLWQLYSAPRVFDKGDAVYARGLARWKLMLRAKWGTGIVLVCLHVVLLAFWIRLAAATTRLSVPESIIGIVDGFTIAAVSISEHYKSSRPSTLLELYLLISIILDVAIVRTLWIREGFLPVAIVTTLILAAKTVLLVFEEWPKQLLLAEQKEIVPETAAGAINRTLFYWINPLLWKGARSNLVADHMPPIHEKLRSNDLLNKLEIAWAADSKAGGMALIRVTLVAYKWQILAGVLPRLLFSGFTFAQPFLVQAVINHVALPGDDELGQPRGKIASGLIGATLLTYVGLAVTSTWYKHMTFQLATMIRGGLAGMVFKKTLAVNAQKVKEESAPTTLMSTDVEGVAAAGIMLHDWWASLVDLPIGIYLLYRQVGIPSLFILVPAVVTTIGSGLIAKDMGPATVAWNQAVQERIGFTSNALSQAKGIKMMGLSGLIRSSVLDLRSKELQVSKKYRWILTRLSILASACNELTPVVIIVSAIYWSKADEGLSVTAAFTSLSIITIASGPVMMILVAFMQLASSIGCFTRLQTFLLEDERKETRQLMGTSPKPDLTSSVPRKNMKKRHEGVDMELYSLPGPEEASLERPHESVVDIREAHVTAGGVDTPILHDVTLQFRTGTLNMLIGRVGGGKTSLLKAIAGEFPLTQGTLTIQAHSMAYCEQTPWLLNISIRDNITRPYEFDEMWLSTVLKACALDQDISLFPKGDQSIVGTGGVALSGGQRSRMALARAIYCRKKLVLLDDIFSGLDTKTSRHVFNRVLGPEGLLRQNQTTVILATHNPQILSAADHITLMEEGRIVHKQLPYSQFDPADLGVLDFEAKRKEADTTEPPPKVHAAETGPETIGAQPDIAFQTEADLSRRTGDVECYKIYLSAMGSKLLVFFFTSLVLQAGLVKMPQIWLRFWVERGTGGEDEGYLAGYILFAAAAVVCGAAATSTIVVYGMPRAGQKLHNDLLTKVFRAPLRFFTTVDSGITLNRFSQDISLIDTLLPMHFYTTCALALSVLAQVGLIASGATYVAALIPACLIVLYMVQKFYLRTSRQMRLLDLEMKSPLYTQFTETLAGLPTIRAFGWSDAWLKDNHRRLDLSQKPYYLMYCIQRWLQVVLDLFVAALALLLVSFSLTMSGTTSSAAIGLALVNLIGFNQSLTMLVEEWTELETSLGAISRLKWFSKSTADENKPSEKDTPASSWPERGSVKLDHVSASYAEGSPPILRDISLEIEPGKRVGICGRSGSGKSSLILALVHLLDLESGSIWVDGVDISTIPREELRSRLTVLPQDPITLQNTVRGNLDPFSRVQSDRPLISVLEKVSLWEIIAAKEGLSTPLSDLSLSSGQLQLLCLARALLNRGSIVLLDEATSSVDHKTEDQVRRVLREDMAGRTIIEVAHRLDVIKSCDVAVVMSEGRIVETGEPTELLSRDSALRTLWESQQL